MIDEIQFIKALLHLWNSTGVVFEYKHTPVDFSEEIKNLYNFSDVKIYGDVIKFGNYNYVFTTEDADYERVLKPMMKIIDTKKTYVEMVRNNELQKDQFVIHLYIDISKNYDTISNFVYNSIKSLPIFSGSGNSFYTPTKILQELNDIQFVCISPVQDIAALMGTDHLQYRGVFYVINKRILSGNSLWNMIYDIKRTNKNSVYIQFKPYAVEMLQKYFYQHHNESFAILLNGSLFSIPMKPLESNVLDNNAWQIAYNIDSGDVKIEDEKNVDSLLNIFKRAKLGYSEVQLVSENSVNFTDTMMYLFICVITLILLLLFFLVVRRRERRKAALATILSSVYAGFMFDGPIRILYLFLIFFDSLFNLIKDNFTVYMMRVVLYTILLISSFFLSISIETMVHNMLIPLLMSTIVHFVIENTVTGKVFEKLEEVN